MKLAAYKDGSRDGQLVVVSRDLTMAHYATDIASRLQQALDDWNFIAAQLQDLYETLNGGKARHAFPFDAAQCLAPLPRAYQWLDGRQREDQPHVFSQPGGALLGARSPICVPVAEELDFCAGLAAVTGDVPAGATREQGQDAIRLLALVNAVSLPADDDDDEDGGAHIAAALGPVAVTPDELGAAWQDTRVHLTLGVAVNGRKLGLIDASQMRWSFGDLIAAAARWRSLSAGAVVGSGAIPSADSVRGFAGLARKRAAERAQDGQPHTPWLQRGDTVRVEMKGVDGLLVFGAMEQVMQ
ncbi:MAG: fumarylacetoacetate hydrolase family protein [Burkholderiaceae bacterium]|jgi:fumarylacetoacetate (FAA) hydrolase|nr:fumarylacetoacetate hydrolase family protein [Burkholderiaceae bacterium]